MASIYTPHRQAFDPAQRGYHAVYRANAVNRCPGCGRSHWLIGRMLAECGFCGTALPLSDAAVQSGTTLFRSHRPVHGSLAA